jgi:hypothetical protein
MRMNEAVAKLKNFPAIPRGWRLAAAIVVGGLVFFLAGNHSVLEPLSDGWRASHYNFRVDQSAISGTLQTIQVLGLALAALGIFMALQLMQTLPAVSNRPRLAAALNWALNNPALLATILLVILALPAIYLNSVEFMGRRYFYLVDDAMISMRYARNLASGEGLVWNPGERVEGYSNFLWVIVMALAHLPGTPEHLTAFVVMAINWGLFIGILWLAQGVLRRLDISLPWQYLIVLLLALDKNLMHWTYSGFETTFTAFIAVLALWGLFSERRYVFGVSLALIPLTRTDAPLIAAILGLLYIWQHRDNPRPAIIFIALTTIPAIAQFVFRLSYYGELLPNTYYQKMSPQVDNRLELGISYAFRLVDYLLLFGVMIGSWFTRTLDMRLRLLSVAVIAQAAYMIYAGGDAFQDLRFLTPTLPFLYIIVGATAYQIAQSAPRREPAWMIALLLIVTAPVAANGGRVLALEYSPAEAQWTALAQLIDANTRSDELILVTGAGTIPYFLEDYAFVDGLGLNDKHIARVDPPTDGIWIGHNKFDYDYVYYERQPNFLVMTFDCATTWNRLLADAELRQERLLLDQRVAWSSHEMYHEVFTNRYLPYPVTVFNTEGRVANTHFCLFRRDDSNIRLVWTFDGRPISRLRLDFEYPFINGGGWTRSRTNANDVSYRQMTGDAAVVTMPGLIPTRRYNLSFRVGIDPEEAANLQLTVNGEPLNTLRVPEANPGVTIFQAVIPVNVADAAGTSLRFDVPNRQEDVTFDWLQIEPAQQ